MTQSTYLIYRVEKIEKAPWVDFKMIRTNPFRDVDPSYFESNSGLHQINQSPSC